MISMCSTPDGLAINVNGTPFSLRKDHPMYTKVLQGLKTGAFNDNEDALVDLLTPKKRVESFLQKAEEADVVLVDEVVYYKGQPVHNSLTEKVKEFALAGFPVQPLLNFLQNIMQNPSMSARQELFDFLNHKQLPITPDGCFLAYKAVRQDGYDIYSGTVKYEVGSEVEMARSDVDDDRRRGCSQGLHAGTLSYVKDFGNNNSKFLTVKINPADVVSVPYDCNCQKLRTWKMFVVGEFNPTWTGFDSSYYDDSRPTSVVSVPSSYVDDLDDEDEDYEEDHISDIEYEAGVAMATADSIKQIVNKYHVRNKYKDKSESFYAGYMSVMNDYLDN